MALNDNSGKVSDQKLEKYITNIENASIVIEKYFDERPTLKANIPETKFVVYNQVVYPIVYEVLNFFYLGGANLYMVMKSKCHLTKTPRGICYYEVKASEQDIFIGKSPIIPQGCPIDRNVVYPSDTVNLQIKL